MSGLPRTAPLTAFINALRYHSGGIADRSANEVPAILQRGEEVLTADDSRHRNNFTGAASLTVDNMTISVSVEQSGADFDAQAFGQRMDEAMKQTAYEAMVNESREGGLLSQPPEAS